MLFLSAKIERPRSGLAVMVPTIWIVDDRLKSLQGFQ